MGRIFCIIGKSASGKDSIYNVILKHDSKLNTYIMYTTRPIREHEIPGVSYHYVNKKDISLYESEGKLIESRTYNTIYGPWTYAMVDDGQIDLSKGDYLIPGTLESYVSLRDYYGRENVIPIYIEVEDGERLLRAINREKDEKEPKYKEVCRRFLADCEDFSEEKLKESGITKRFINDHKDRCTREIIDFIRAHASSTLQKL